MIVKATLALAVLAGSSTVARAEEAWPAGASPAEVGRRVAERYLATPHLQVPGYPFTVYQEVVTWYGGLTFARLADDKALGERLVARFEPFFTPEQAWRVPPVDHVDNNVFGAVPLEIYMQTRRPRYRALGLTIADGQWDDPTPDGLTRQARFWIDDMYMITAVQVQAFRATRDARYLDRAAAAMAVYLDRLQQPNGLFFHAPDVPFFWGRGNGWMAAGMTELLRSLPPGHPHHARILAAYRKMMATLLAHQAPDGMWRQLVDRPESWPESSSTGMFTFAFVTGVRNGWLDAKTYGPAARRAWLTLVGSYLNADGDVREVCVGTGKKDDYQYYLDRPRAVGDFHGQAPILWSASAWLREAGAP
jgi:rhamnogalacturonyl hydrolase YesR